MDNIVWNQKTYKQFIKEIKTYGDSEYKKFHSKLLKSDISLIGVRTPILKNIAKDLIKTDYKAWLKYNKHQFYEENILHGLVITYAKVSWDEFIMQFDEFVSYIDNWAVCDIVCANAKIFTKNLESGLEYILKCLQDSNYWRQRVGLVLLLDYYINDQYINKVLEIANDVNSKDYYVQMANAWLISICYIKYPKLTNQFLQNTKIDDWTYNKIISKICDSKRVSKEEKQRLKIHLKH